MLNTHKTGLIHCNINLSNLTSGVGVSVRPLFLVSPSDLRMMWPQLSSTGSEKVTATTVFSAAPPDVFAGKRLSNTGSARSSSTQLLYVSFILCVL